MQIPFRLVLSTTSTSSRNVDVVSWVKAQQAGNAWLECTVSRLSGPKPVQEMFMGLTAIASSSSWAPRSLRLPLGITVIRRRRPRLYVRPAWHLLTTPLKGVAVLLKFATCFRTLKCNFSVQFNVLGSLRRFTVFSLTFYVSSMHLFLNNSQIINFHPALGPFAKSERSNSL